ncbi:MAG: iron-containing alcohol dehydrogenase [Pseudomonadota bacterium]
MMMQADWSYPTTVWFGVGRINELARACRQSGITAPLLVTDRGLARTAMVTHIREHLIQESLKHELFGEVDANPDEANLMAGLAAFAENNHDGVIALGGGSALDLGKAVAFMVGQRRPVWDFEDVGDNWRRADTTQVAPVVAVPTTAGTGSEVGRAFVLSAVDTKKIIFHPTVLPRLALCDPQLTTTMPPATTAGTGMDALAHCLEAFCAPAYHPMSHGIALEGMRLVMESLPRAYQDGHDLEARAHMMSAAAMGATAFQKGLGAIHAISHPVGAITGAHHGTLNGIVMPAVLRFNRPAIETQINQAAGYLGIAEGFDGFYARIMALRETLAIPPTLAHIGLRSDHLADVVTRALADPSCAGNPVPMTADNTRRLIESCL